MNFQFYRVRSFLVLANPKSIFSFQSVSKFSVIEIDFLLKIVNCELKIVQTGGLK